MNLVDLVRFLVVAMGGLVFGLSVFVMRLYWYANKLLKRSGERIPGALPYHVAAISLSHLILVGVAMGHAAYRHGAYRSGGVVGENYLGLFWWWGTPLVLFSFSLSLFALLDMLKYQQMRVHKLLKGTKPVSKEVN